MMGHNTRQLPVGDKVFITKIDVHEKNDKIMLTVVECVFVQWRATTLFLQICSRISIPKGLPGQSGYIAGKRRN